MKTQPAQAAGAPSSSVGIVHAPDTGAGTTLPSWAAPAMQHAELEPQQHIAGADIWAGSVHS